jgi:hypothetical protein
MGVMAKMLNNAGVYSEGFPSSEVKLTNLTGFISYEFSVIGMFTAIQRIK